MAGIIWFVLNIVYLLVCVGLVFLVLIQETKSGGLAGVFGAGGGSQTLFGSSAFEFVQKATLIGMISFFLIAFLFTLRRPTYEPKTIMQGAGTTATQGVGEAPDTSGAPAEPAAPAQ